MLANQIVALLSVSFIHFANSSASQDAFHRDGFVDDPRGLNSSYSDSKYKVLLSPRTWVVRLFVLLGVREIGSDPFFG